MCQPSWNTQLDTCLIYLVFVHNVYQTLCGPVSEFILIFLYYFVIYFRLWSSLPCCWELEMKLQRRNWSAQEPFNEFLIFSSSKLLLKADILNEVKTTYWKFESSRKCLMSSWGRCWIISVSRLRFILYFKLCRYPYNNALHHHVESIILSCLESKNDAIVDHLLQECDLIGRFLQTDKHPILSGDSNQVDVNHIAICAFC